MQIPGFRCAHPGYTLRHDPLAKILGGVFREGYAGDLNPSRIVRNHVRFGAPEFSGKILDLRARGGLKPGRKTAKIRPPLFQNQPKPLRNVVHALRSAPVYWPNL